MQLGGLTALAPRSDTPYLFLSLWHHYGCLHVLSSHIASLPVPVRPLDGMPAILTLALGQACSFILAKYGLLWLISNVH